MASQDKSMCIDDHGLYDDDELGGWINNFLKDPVPETLDGDVLSEDFSKLGPIPSEVFREVLTPVGVGGAAYADFLTGYGGCSNVGTFEAEFKPIIHKQVSKSHLKPQQPTRFSQEKKYRIPKSFEAPSPDSVLERRTSSSAGKAVSFGIEIAIPVRTRTKRSRSQSGSSLTANTWLKSIQQFPIQRVRKKRRKLPQHDDPNEVKKCSHCEITKTPQWREGPMGPKTLCNACGVRYRSGRLFPEYRPAASPTFIPSLHSNSHRKVVEMRQKGAAMNNYVMKKPFDELKCSNSTL
ncbi:putative transcription factor C2C2-GATA family [Helianthus anomalus]